MLGLRTNRPKIKEPDMVVPETVVEVYGRTEGSITGADKVIVAPTGCCKSNVKAAYLDIAGEVYGDVDVEELVIRRAGRLYGQVRYKKLILAEGAVFRPNDGRDGTETSSRPAEKVVGPRLVSQEAQARTVPLRRGTSAGQLCAASEENKKTYRAEALEKEQQEPCFITSF
ncbi:MAG TPA: polymer-forming cytoskeletal protein [Firmicutes bacterium]|nr:polymer-forming cytoskeletal protein [Bacillota bacterium]